MMKTEDRPIFLITVIATMVFMSWPHHIDSDILMNARLSQTFLDRSPVHTNSIPFNGILNAEWCQSPLEPPLPFNICKHQDTLFRFGVHGGLTNALHFIMKGALWAFGEDMCFFLDEQGLGSKMAERTPPIPSLYPFLPRYFEPIGVGVDSELAQSSLKRNHVFTPTYQQIQYHEYGKHSGGLQVEDYPDRHKLRDIQSLNLYGKDNIWLKKYIIRRLIRFLPHVRGEACNRLHEHGLNHEEYMAMSVRRGDKSLEYKVEESMQPYIDKAEQAIATHFGGRVPLIFVASDDCTVMSDLRMLRPQWMYVSECDTSGAHDTGFVIADMSFWTAEQTDAHYMKFFAELIAMASAKYWIGVSNTNVSLFLYWMRHFDATDDTFVFVDNPDRGFVH